MEVIKTFMKMKVESKWENTQDGEHLADELEEFPCLYEKGNKGYKDRDQEKNIWRRVKQFLIVFL